MLSFKRVNAVELLRFAIGFLLICICLSAQTVYGLQEPQDAEKANHFENKIRPVLIKHCYECHSAESEDVGGNLLLDSRASSLKGGDLGPALIPGKPAESLIVKALNHVDLEMPPDGKLSAAIIADFEQWIRDGAIDPRNQTSARPTQAIDIEKGREFWSFQPIQDFVFSPKLNAGELNPIDFLVEKQLKKNGLEFADEAKPLELLERVYFDLIGLPPPLAVQTKFEKGELNLAEVVDELLASKQFGERFGRRWLDVARYADSSGGGRVLLFPDAWRYRDYVVRSFNQDKPFDQFIREQIAGDLLVSEDLNIRSDQLTATGFLMLGAHNYELQDKELLRMEVVDEQINVVGRAFLGLTLSCARCHDHKFDPIPTSDYYALAGIFRSTKSLLPGNVSRYVTTNLPLPPDKQKQLDESKRQRATIEKEIKSLQSKIKSLESNRVTSFDAQDLKSFPGQILDEDQAVRQGTWTQSTSVKPFIGSSYHHSPDPAASMTYRLTVSKPGSYLLRAAYTASSNRSDSARYQIKVGSLEKTVVVNQRRQPPIEAHFAKLMNLNLKQGEVIEVTLRPGQNGTTIADAVHLLPTKAVAEKKKEDPKQTELLKSLRDRLAMENAKLKKLDRSAIRTTQVMSVRDEDQPEDFFVCVRGDVHSLGKPVKRSGLRVLGELDHFSQIQGSGRLELADWIASSSNPLTSRVYANRVWAWVFGQGIVETPDNFGATGQNPLNQELLDYLAHRLIQHGWSTKRLVRDIVLSKTYRQSSGIESDSRDPGNRLFSRHPRKRLDAESIRDRMLAFSGLLEESTGGPSIKPGTKKEFGYKYDSHKRSLYLPVFRNTLNELFEVFDFPNPNLVSGKRTSSVLPTQALYMMNNSFVAEQSLAAAKRILEQDFDTFQQQLNYAYRLAISRPPSELENQIASRYFGSSNQANPGAVLDQKKWQLFCQLLISSIDFRYLK